MVLGVRCSLLKRSENLVWNMSWNSQSTRQHVHAAGDWAQGTLLFGQSLWQCVIQSIGQKNAQNPGLWGEGRRVKHPQILSKNWLWYCTNPLGDFHLPLPGSSPSTTSCSLWSLPQNGKNQSPHCDQEHNKAPLRPLQKAPDVQCFLWQLNRCAIPEQPPQMTFSYYTPKALSSTVWLLADFCCKCRVLSCSSYLPSNCISQTHLKATSSPTAFHYFFLPNLFPL